MAINLLELMQGAIGDQVADKLAGIVGEDSGAARKAVGGILPTVLGCLIKTSSTPEGANHLGSVVDQADGSIIDNLDKILGGADGGSDRLMQMGEGLVGGLLGDNKNGVIDIISKVSGLGSGGTGKLMGLIVPLIFSILGKQKSSLGLDAGGLASLLGDQAGFLKGMLPGGMGSLLGLGADFDSKDGILGAAQDAIGGAADKVGDVAGAAAGAVGGAVDTAGDLAGDAKDAVGGAVNKAADVAGDAKDAVAGAAGAAADTAGEAVKKGGGLLKLLLPIIILVVLGLAALKFLKKPDGGGGAAAPVKAPAIADLAPDNALTSINGVFKDATSVFKGIKDVDSANAAAPKIDDMTAKVTKLAGMKDQLPAGMGDQVLDAIKGFVPKFNPLVKKAYSFPGVEAAIGPKVDAFMAAFEPFNAEG